MYHAYDLWPQLATKSYQDNTDEVDFKEIKHIVFSGMGGSGSLGDVFSAILSKTNIHVNVVKGYHLPNTVSSDTLVVTTSISGNTVETCSVLDQARKLDSKIIAFSSGGKIEQYCLKHNIEYRKIRQIHSPRASFTIFLYSMLKVLQPIIPIKKNMVNESLEILKNTNKKISSSELTKDNPALSLAYWIDDIPLVYYPWGLQAAAIRFKNSLQENAKTHTMIEDVIEASHNGIVAWEKRSSTKPILIKGYNDYIKTKERWKILEEYFAKNKIEYREVLSGRGNILSKLVNLIYLLDYCSIYRAVLSKVDPSPVESIDFIKNRL
jgi:glucose/mannose-6-phosphate isomerase